MDKIKRFSKGFASVVFFLISVYNFYFSCAQQTINNTQRVLNDSLSYFSNAATFRPEITLYSDPRVRVDSIANLIDSMFFRHSDSTIISKMYLDYFIQCRYVFLNKGNSRARILMLSVSDTNSYSEFLRERLLTGRLPLMTREGTLFDYQIEISSKDTSSFVFHIPIQGLSNGEYYLHVLCLYENELGNLFDSYIVTKHFIKSPSRYDFIYTGFNFSEQVGRNITSRIYSKVEKENFFRTIGFVDSTFNKTAPVGVAK